MMDLQSLATTESTPEAHDFGREEAMALASPATQDGLPTRDALDTARDQLDALIADEMFTA